MTTPQSGTTNDQSGQSSAHSSGEPTGEPTGQSAPQGTGSGEQSTSEQQSSQSGETDYRKLYEDTLAESRKWEKRAKDNNAKAKKLDEIEQANATELEKATSRAETAETKAAQAVTAAVNAEIRAAAIGWADPTDAPRYLDDKTAYVTDEGDIDREAIARDVGQVLSDRPHLTAPSNSGGSGDEGQGRRTPNPDPSQGSRQPTSLTEQIRAAESGGDWQQALALKTEQAMQAAQRARG